MKTQNISILDQNLSLHPYKGLFWKEKELLVLSDLHLGKAAHFRKSGIAIPSSVHLSDYRRMEHLLAFYQPKEVLFLGDLFHSDFNEDCTGFREWIKKYEEIKFTLVKGNHDILNDHHYDSLIVHDRLIMPPFAFSHIPVEPIDDLYVVCGHVHPAVSVVSGPKQSSRISCFYFSKNIAILPSFGNFTGNSKISIKFEDKVYLILEERVVPFNNISLSA